MKFLWKLRRLFKGQNTHTDSDFDDRYTLTKAENVTLKTAKSIKREPQFSVPAKIFTGFTITCLLLTTAIQCTIGKDTTVIWEITNPKTKDEKHVEQKIGLDFSLMNMGKNKGKDAQKEQITDNILGEKMEKLPDIKIE